MVEHWPFITVATRFGLPKHPLARVKAHPRTHCGLVVAVRVLRLQQERVLVAHFFLRLLGFRHLIIIIFI